MSTALTPAQKTAANKRTAIATMLERCSDRYGQVLDGKILTPSKMISFALTALTRSPALLECTPVSVAFAVQLAAEAGLPVDGYHAHLIPYGKEAKFIPDYKGLISLAFDHGILIRPGVVYSKDEFHYELGLNQSLVHKPCPDAARGEKTHAYAVGQLQDGRQVFVVASRREIEKRKAVSKAKSGPWTDWEDEMWMKTACKMLLKFLPRSPQMRAAVINDDMVEAGLTTQQEREYGATLVRSGSGILDDALAHHAGTEAEGGEDDQAEA